MSILEVFFTQTTPLARLVLAGLATFAGVGGFLAGGTSGGRWDLDEGIEMGVIGALGAAILVASLWAAGLVVCILIQLFGGVSVA